MTAFIFGCIAGIVFAILSAKYPLFGIVYDFIVAAATLFFVLGAYIAFGPWALIIALILPFPIVEIGKKRVLIKKNICGCSECYCESKTVKE